MREFDTYIRCIPIRDGDVVRVRDFVLRDLKSNINITEYFNIIVIGNNIPKFTIKRLIKKIFVKLKPFEIWYDIMFKENR